MDPELLAYFDRRFAETNQRIADLRGETARQVGDLATGLRHARVLLEDVHSKVELLAEGLATVNEKVDRVEARLDEQAKEGLVPVRLAVRDHTVSSKSMRCGSPASSG